MTKRLTWTCPCGKVIQLWPSRAKTRRVCSRTCPAKRRPGGAVAAANRITRIMLTYGLASEREARVWLHGWRHGQQATISSFHRKRDAQRKKVGTAAWERTA
jgi:hypothetical protein